MPTLEETVLHERIEEAEGFLASKLELTHEQRQKLNNSRPKIVINDNLGIHAGYDILNNVYLFSRAAISNFLAVGEEVAHSIRLRLNSAARDYLLNPANNLAVNAKEYIQSINMEEYFARYGALLYSNFKGHVRGNLLWSRIKDAAVHSFTKTFDYISHFFGYRKAERDYAAFGASKFNKNALYTNDASQIQMGGQYRLAA